MNKNTSIIKTIVDIGIFSALGFVFDELQGIFSKGIFVNGGSIGFAMIVLIIIGARRGIIPALITGLIMGLLDVATGPYVLSFAQVLLDYVFPYFFAALACLLVPIYKKAKTDKDKILILLLITLLAGIFKFFSHYLAGIFFWADPSGFAWDLTNINPYLYCFIYNIAFIGPSIILCQLLILVLYKRIPTLFTNKQEVSTQKLDKKLPEVMFFSSLLSVGVFLVIFFSIKYANSFYSEYDGWGTDVSFDSNYMMCLITGIWITLISLNGIFVKLKLNRDSYRLTTYQIILHCIINVIFAITMVIKASKKDKDVEFNRIQLLVSFLFGFLVTFVYVKYFKKAEQKKSVSTPSI